VSAIPPSASEQPVLPEPDSGTPSPHASRITHHFPYIVLTGNPNCGKTTLFNALTGLRAKVGNYAGVTVERKEGKLLGAPAELNPRVLDLPGTYSLSPQSLDEQISRDVLLNRLPELPAPSLIVVVVDASNLQRNLYYATQVIELGHPTLIALNMIDVAEANGHQIDSAKLADLLGVGVLPVVASSGQGIPELRQRIVESLATAKAQVGRASPRADEISEPLAVQRLAGTLAPPSIPRQFCDLAASFKKEADDLALLLAETFHERRTQAKAEALLILSNEKALASSLQHYPANIQQAVAAARQRLDSAGMDWRGAPIEARYVSVSCIQRAVTTESAAPGETFSDRLDRILTHKVWGTLIFVALMAVMFQSIFTFARIPMDALQAGVDWLAGTVSRILGPGELNSLLADGIIAGVGAVIVFLPQILLLFLFIGFLEDTGYMARAAFLMDRLMSKVGLHGKSFIPMLSSFACAIPGIMATRTIESPKDRLVTILVAPLMSCSARLPVYTLLIAACIPNTTVFGFLKLTGLTMLSMYLLGIIVALLMAWLFKKTLLKGETPMLIMELPPYKRPLARVVVRHMWDRSRLFLRRAGTVILGINILLWFLATYPHNKQITRDFAARRAAIAEAAQPSAADQIAALDNEEAGAKLRQSFAGYLGRAIEPIIAPLGFDWKMGIGIISSFAAREVFVSTMSTVYNVGKAEKTESSMNSLARTLQSQKRSNGSPVYTPLIAVTLMVFYVFALQCVSTVAIVRRETNSWKWPFFQWVYMGALAWTFAFLTYRIGQLLGWS
jgi:ferrous iron transport protein B